MLKTAVYAAFHQPLSTTSKIKFKEQGGKTTIEFSFFERFANGTSASERGIYKYTYTPSGGEHWSGYGQFHVFSRKEKGRWKIAVDYDSSEGNTVGAAEFKAGKRTEDW